MERVQDDASMASYRIKLVGMGYICSNRDIYSSWVMTPSMQGSIPGVCEVFMLEDP